MVEQRSDIGRAGGHKMSVSALAQAAWPLGLKARSSSAYASCHRALPATLLADVLHPSLLPAPFPRRIGGRGMHRRACKAAPGFWTQRVLVHKQGGLPARASWPARIRPPMHTGRAVIKQTELFITCAGRATCSTLFALALTLRWPRFDSVQGWTRSSTWRGSRIELHALSQYRLLVEQQPGIPTSLV